MMVNEAMEQRMDELVDALEAKDIPYDEVSFQALAQLAWEMGQENGWVYTPDADRPNNINGGAVDEAGLSPEIQGLLASFRAAGADVQVFKA